MTSPVLPNKARYIHGYLILARVSSLNGTGTDDYVLVAGHRDYITGWVRTGDPAPAEWVHGHYFSLDATGLHDAIHDLETRAGYTRRDVTA